MLDHLTYNNVFRNIGIVFGHVRPCQQSQINCDLWSSSVVCEVSVTFFSAVSHFECSFFNAFLNRLQVFFLILVVPAHLYFPKLIVCFVVVLASILSISPFPSKKNWRIYRLCHSVNRVVIPRVPHYDIVVDSSFLRVASLPDDVIKLCNFFPKSWTWRAFLFAQSQCAHVEMTLQLNFFTLLCNINFLKLSWSFSLPCQHKNSYTASSLQISFSSILKICSSILREPIIKIFDFCRTSFPQDLHNAQDECSICIQIFPADWSRNVHRKNDSKNNDHTSLFERPGSLNFEKSTEKSTWRVQICCRNKQFLVRHVPDFASWKKKLTDTCTRVQTNVSSFFFPISHIHIDDWHWLKSSVWLQLDFYTKTGPYGSSVSLTSPSIRNKRKKRHQNMCKVLTLHAYR